MRIILLFGFIAALWALISACKAQKMKILSIFFASLSTVFASVALCSEVYSLISTMGSIGKKFKKGSMEFLLQEGFEKSENRKKSTWNSVSKKYKNEPIYCNPFRNCSVKCKHERVFKKENKEYNVDENKTRILHEQNNHLRGLYTDNKTIKFYYDFVVRCCSHYVYCQLNVRENIKMEIINTIIGLNKFAIKKMENFVNRNKLMSNGLGILILKIYFSELIIGGPAGQFYPILNYFLYCYCIEENLDFSRVISDSSELEKVWAKIGETFSEEFNQFSYFNPFYTEKRHLDFKVFEKWINNKNGYVLEFIKLVDEGKVNQEEEMNKFLFQFSDVDEKIHEIIALSGLPRIVFKKLVWKTDISTVDLTIEISQEFGENKFSINTSINGVTTGKINKNDFSDKDERRIFYIYEILEFFRIVKQENLTCCFVCDKVSTKEVKTYLSNEFYYLQHSLSIQEVLEHFMSGKTLIRVPLLTKNINVFEGLFSEKIMEVESKISETDYEEIEFRFGEENFQLFMDYMNKMNIPDIVRHNIRRIILGEFNSKIIPKSCKFFGNWQWKRLWCDLSYFHEKMKLTSVKGSDYSLNPRRIAMGIFNKAKPSVNGVPIKNKRNIYLNPELVCSNNKVMLRAVKRSEDQIKEEGTCNLRIKQGSHEYKYVNPVIETSFFTSGDNTKIKTYRDSLRINSIKVVKTNEEKENFRQRMLNNIEFFIKERKEIPDYKSFLKKREVKPNNPGKLKRKAPKSLNTTIERRNNKRKNTGRLKTVKAKNLNSVWPKKGRYIKLENYWSRLEEIKDEEPTEYVLNEYQNDLTFLERQEYLSRPKSSIKRKVAFELRKCKESEIKEREEQEKEKEEKLKMKNEEMKEKINLEKEKEKEREEEERKKKNDEAKEKEKEKEEENNKKGEEETLFEFKIVNKKKLYYMDGRNYTLTKLIELIKKKPNNKALMERMKKEAEAHGFKSAVEVKKEKGEGSEPRWRYSEGIGYFF